jgi:hypothetical protein
VDFIMSRPARLVRTAQGVLKPVEPPAEQPGQAARNDDSDQQQGSVEEVTAPSSPHQVTSHPKRHYDTEESENEDEYRNPSAGRQQISG